MSKAVAAERKHSNQGVGLLSLPRASAIPLARDRAVSSPASFACASSAAAVVAWNAVWSWAVSRFIASPS